MASPVSASVSLLLKKFPEAAKQKAGRQTCRGRVRGASDPVLQSKVAGIRRTLGPCPSSFITGTATGADGVASSFNRGRSSGVVDRRCRLLRLATPPRTGCSLRTSVRSKSCLRARRLLGTFSSRPPFERTVIPLGKPRVCSGGNGGAAQIEPGMEVLQISRTSRPDAQRQEMHKIAGAQRPSSRAHQDGARSLDRAEAMDDAPEGFESGKAT